MEYCFERIFEETNEINTNNWYEYINKGNLPKKFLELLADSKVKGMPLQIQPANLKLYLPLDDYTAGTALNAATFLDLSGNGNNGTGVDADADSTCVGEEILNSPTIMNWQ